MSIESAIVKTYFSKENYPVNLFTLEDWKQLAEAMDSSILEAMKSFTRQKGGAFLISDNEILVVLTLRSTGNIECNMYMPGEWSFETPPEY